MMKRIIESRETHLKMFLCQHITDLSENGGEFMSKTEELKQELQVLTSRRDRMQKNLYEVEKRINEITIELKKNNTK
ncbi:hypothetical protein, partial [Neobacillus vireti]|uniref:hypothetical protein n=1 Tax=Neobacillus vireti TaxID=220686 RepID=UPI002FFE6D01